MFISSKPSPTVPPFSVFTVQREKDRERAQARNGSKNSKNKDDGLTPEQRRERDGKALQEKAAKKAAQAEAAGGSKENKGTAKNSKK
ncbi:hypothetical protein DM860_002500 [Cuscuta australis]|uniref:Small EDRK-rich factor-like N-terminal domain-containing protein n=1 Tax=Cuscuta australis TaxID=267555 RepID=A0A328CYJ1_9ASTE|nr:hypothetical protein DM860_002500 [Cuscuta australis]